MQTDTIVGRGVGILVLTSGPEWEARHGFRFFIYLQLYPATTNYVLRIA